MLAHLPFKSQCPLLSQGVHWSFILIAHGCIEWVNYDYGLNNNITLDVNEMYPYFNGFSRLKSWDVASMLGLVNMNGT
jgi:hypothetical protein